jgi:hypothetical protein
MLRRALAHHPPQLCLRAKHTGSEVELRLAYPASAPWAHGDAADAAAQAAADWALIDTLATHWSHRGDHSWHTQWAILPSDPGEPHGHDAPVSCLCLYASAAAAPFTVASGQEDTE